MTNKHIMIFQYSDEDGNYYFKCNECGREIRIGDGFKVFKKGDQKVEHSGSVVLDGTNMDIQGL